MLLGGYFAAAIAVLVCATATSAFTNNGTSFRRAQYPSVCCSYDAGRRLRIHCNERKATVLHVLLYYVSLLFDLFSLILPFSLSKISFPSSFLILSPLASRSPNFISCQRFEQSPP